MGSRYEMIIADLENEVDLVSEKLMEQTELIFTLRATLDDTLNELSEVSEKLESAQSKIADMEEVFKDMRY